MSEFSTLGENPLGKNIVALRGRDREPRRVHSGEQRLQNLHQDLHLGHVHTANRPYVILTSSLPFPVALPPNGEGRGAP